jgi:nucleoid DNA-binding protein
MAARKKTTKKKVSKKKVVKKKAATGRKPMTKSALLNVIADATDLSRKQVQHVLDVLRNTMVEEINPRKKASPGVFTIPGVCKVRTVKKPARKARKGTNPFTGEEMMFKAKPASIAIRMRPIKAFKDEVN